MATGAYTETAVAMATEHKDFVIGFICRRKLSEDPSFIHMTPGVQLQQGKDALGTYKPEFSLNFLMKFIGQQYLTPDDVITKNGSDVIIVGRGIFAASDPDSVARQYKEAGWSAYLAKFQQ